MALDQFRDGLPDHYRGLNAPPGTTGAAGLNVVPNTAQDPAFTEVVFGEDGQKVLRGMRRAMRAMIDAGVNIIIDDILLTPDFLHDYLEVFNANQVLLVGVRCDLRIIEAREAQRLGRFPGTAAGQFISCHAHETYDVEVDTGRQSPEACAAQVIDAVGRPATAFARLLERA
jgi:chloramphenicol 3-O phosphotransferase